MIIKGQSQGGKRHVRDICLQVTSGDVVLSNEWLLNTDDIVDTAVGVEVGLDVVEDRNRTISTSAGKLTASSGSRRECDGVVEGETEGLVSLLSALVVEELGHDLVPEGEEGAARCVGRGVLAIGTSNALGERS